MSGHAPDAHALLQREEFIGADCLWTDGRFVAHEIVGDALVPRPDVALDLRDVVDATPLFARTLGGATYGGGESTAHGSFGFFFKRDARGLAWALSALESDPFVDVEVTPSEARFRSRSGDVWIVERDDVARTRIRRRSR